MADLIDREALLESMGLTDAVKYGNKDAEQQYRSYSTWMSYEIADSIWDAPAVNRWISVEDALPDDRKCVLVTDGEDIEITFFDGSHWEMHDQYGNHYEMYGTVTHWMPLPSTDGLT